MTPYSNGDCRRQFVACICCGLGLLRDHWTIGCTDSIVASLESSIGQSMYLF